MISPITNKDKGFAMAGQTKILDMEARNYDFIEIIPNDILDEALKLVASNLKKG